jgi:hypothetical protein
VAIPERAWYHWESCMARGHSGAPYDWLGAIAGVAYLVAVIWRRVRG